MDIEVYRRGDVCQQSFDMFVQSADLYLATHLVWPQGENSIGV